MQCFTMDRSISIYRYHLSSIGNLFVVLRQSYHSLISTMGFPGLTTTHPDILWNAWRSSSSKNHACIYNNIIYVKSSTKRFTTVYRCSQLLSSLLHICITGNKHFPACWQQLVSGRLLHSPKPGGCRAVSEVWDMTCKWHLYDWLA